MTQQSNSAKRARHATESAAATPLLAASYRTLFNAIGDAVFVYRIDEAGQPGGFVEVNEVACRWLGYTRDELLSFTPYDILGPQGLTATRHPRLLIDKAVLFQTTLLTRDGTEIPVESNAHLFELQGESAVLSIVRDMRERKREQRALRTAEKKYRAIFENAAEGIYQSTPDGRLIDANPALARLLGYTSAQELLASDINNVLRFYVEPQCRTEIARLLEKQGFYTDVEYEIRRPDGSHIWVSDSARAIRGKDGTILYYEGTVQDVTKRRFAEDALAQSEEKYRTLIDTSQDGVFIAQHRSLRYVNQSLARMIGYEPDAMHGIEVLSFIAPEDRAAAQAIYDTFRDSAAGPSRMDINLLHQDGKTRIAVSVHFGNILYRGEQAITGTVRDVTEQKRAERQLLHNAFHDALTGLPNRSFFMTRLTDAINRAKRMENPKFAVLFLDLDRFKLINDSLGHAFGDLLLQQISQRLQECLRPGDLLSRHGGDEFTIIVENVNQKIDALNVAERIHENFTRPFVVGENEVFMSTSIGVVFNNPDYATPDAMLRDADTAMYRAKADGKAGYAVFDDDMHAIAKRHLRLETDLRHALDRNELTLYFQPVMDLDQVALAGFEALLRWDHPEFGMLNPSEFLNIAEESGLIMPLGEWVLRTACLQLAEWHKLYPAAQRVGISVNLAHRQFTHGDLAATVAHVLESSGLQPDLLRLEITERVFMEDPTRARELLCDLKALHVALQLDDFGTGFSALSSLRNYPLDTLKIDRSFVHDIEHDADDLAIVRTIAALASDLHMTIVAEGVETARQCTILREIGCQYAQGFYFAKPLPAREAATLLAAIQ